MIERINEITGKYEYVNNVNNIVNVSTDRPIIINDTVRLSTSNMVTIQTYDEFGNYIVIDGEGRRFRSIEEMMLLGMVK